MSLISILMIATAVLALLSGLIFLVGSSKSDRGRGVWVFMIGLGCALWTFGCGSFLALPSDASDSVVAWSLFGIYIGGLLLAFSVLVYAAWWCRNEKIRRFSRLYVIACGLFMLFMAVKVIYDRGLLYNTVTLSPTGNSLGLYWGWYYIAYCVCHLMMFGGFLLFQYINARTARLKRIKRGDYVLFFGFLIGSMVSLAFNLLLPPVDYSLIWVGPLSLDVVLIAFFFTALKYRTVSIANRWLQILAYAVTLLAGVVAYMMIFYLIFTALFKIPNPSASILVLNFIMIIIVLLLMPVINEVNAALRSLISVGQVDIAYVVKKLNHLATRNVDLRDLAGFLADHLHFAYIGFIINRRIYGSKSLAVSPAELSGITHLKSTGRGEIWQEPNKTVQKTFDELGLYAVAELRNAKGKTFGQIIVGKPMGKSNFERRDLLQLEMIINLVATVIDSEKHLRA